MFACSLPKEFQGKTKLDRQACMSIKLWKHYDIRTDEERDAYLRKFYMRFHKQKSAELNSNASAALNDYEVGCQTMIIMDIAIHLFA